MCSFKRIIYFLLFILVFTLLIFYQFSDNYFPHIERIHFPKIDTTFDLQHTFLNRKRTKSSIYNLISFATHKIQHSETISKIYSKYTTEVPRRSSNSLINEVDSNTELLPISKIQLKEQSLKAYSKYKATFRSSTVDIVTKSDNEKSTNYHDHSWIRTFNHTIDYGDKTCDETKNGNPNRAKFVRLLNHWNMISQNYNIPYFLVYGSLIGAVRNADFIPWDHDMDIIVDETFYETLSKIDNIRNFTSSDNGSNFHLVVQNYFRSDYSNMHKPRQNCLGQVRL